MDADEDFVFLGTPIERAEEVTSRKKKAAAEASGHLRSLPVWKQEVTDEEGRRRFHGAFTGGFSAGYYNTVGSKEGWTPQSFTSSRKKRAELKEQNIYSFMDEDEKAELQGRGLGTSSLFDTFGFTAAEVARKGVEKEVQQRLSAIPGPVPDELFVPTADSIGIKLLLKMGWRRGHAIKESQPSSSYDVRREARKAFLALSSDASKSLKKNETDAINFDRENGSEQEDISDFRALLSQNLPIFVLHPKQDLHGLGYDPFKHAPEFRERKRQQAADNNRRGSREAVSTREKLFSSNSGKVAPGFGIGALEELDVEDEDIYASGFEFEETCIDEVEEPIKINTSKKLQLTEKEHSGLSGFKLSSNSDYHIERFKPPVIPPGFEPHHKFSAPLDVGGKFADTPPPEVPPPVDKNLKLLIEGFASLVGKCGKLFEDLSREKNKANPLFSFLTGGYGHEYYVRKLWEEQQKQSANKQPADDKSTLSNVTKKKLTAETRGKILGERPLGRSSPEPSTSASGHLQINLSDTFTAPLSLEGLPADIKPFKDDPGKQERFEQFLKDKYEGGLRSTKSGGSNMSEVERARERLDFEATAEAIEKVKWNRNFEQPLGMQFTLEGQLVSSGLELSKPSAKTELPNIKYPRREEYQWRPSPLLCKRFDIIDPFMGQPVPMSRARSRLDSMIIPTDFPKMVSAETVAGRNSDPVPRVEESYKEASAKEVEINDNPSVERPVDLYKAIFSDDSDDEDADPQPNPKQGDPVEKRNDVANTTLNRLMAGDFLESLGKELGLEVPPDPLYYSTNKTNTSSLEMETGTLASQIASKNVESKDTLQNYEHTSRVEKGDYHGNKLTTNIVEKVSNNRPEDKSGDLARNEKNDASKTQKRRHSNRSSSSDTESSDDTGHESRSRREYERHSSQKSSSKHSKHREHKQKRSHSSSRRHRSEESRRQRDSSKSRNGSEDQAGRSSKDDDSKSDHKKKHRRQ